MKSSIKAIFTTWLAKRETRAKFHAVILIIGAGILLILGFDWNELDNIPLESDKYLHFITGRVIASAIFYITYLSIIARVLLIGRGKGSITAMLLWIPTIIGAGFILAIGLSFIVAIGKELLDMGGLGNPEWLDLTVTFDGAMTVLPTIAIIMALTPLFIPMDMMLQLPKLMLKDMKTGFKPLDNYLGVIKSQEKIKKTASVLIVEDDLTCASTIINFCKNINLKSHHVTTTSEAETYMNLNSNSVKILFLDNFVGTDQQGINRTGSEWLLMRKDKYPKNKRPFLIIIISGHTEYLGEAKNHADLVLSKPWDPRVLLDYLKNKQVVVSFAQNHTKNNLKETYGDKKKQHDSSY